nr:hypothetical protein CFP56_69300 [Quercus suber]
MEVQKAEGGIYPVAFFVMLMLINAHCCGAAVLVKSNASVRCDDHPSECLIEDEVELEYLMNPYISRMLVDPPKEHPGEDAVYKPDKACEDKCSNHRCLKRHNTYRCNSQ